VWYTIPQKNVQTLFRFRMGGHNLSKDIGCRFNLSRGLQISTPGPFLLRREVVEGDSRHILGVRSYITLEPPCTQSAGAIRRVAPSNSRASFSLHFVVVNIEMRDLDEFLEAYKLQRARDD